VVEYDLGTDLELRVEAVLVLQYEQLLHVAVTGHRDGRIAVDRRRRVWLGLGLLDVVLLGWRPEYLRTLTVQRFLRHGCLCGICRLHYGVLNVHGI